MLDPILYNVIVIAVPVSVGIAAAALIYAFCDGRKKNNG